MRKSWIPKTESRIWFRSRVRDNSGSVEVGIPEKAAFSLASVTSKDAFLQKHQDGSLGFPLLCHVRISRSTRENSGGAVQSAVYVNHVVEAIEIVAWNPESAPNISYEDVLGEQLPTAQRGHPIRVSARHPTRPS